MRKAEHLDLAKITADGPGTNGFEDIYLLQDSIPELDLDEIDLRVEFLNKTLDYPLLIDAMTGGTDKSLQINRILAAAASKYGLAMAVGSMTVAIENPALRNSFTIVRETNPDGIILANLGANCSPRNIGEAVNMIAADGLQLHFNVPQELAMREGDRSFRGILDNVKRIADTCKVPVIAKEVGFGFTRETVAKLYAAGINIFDNGGKGGTNFIAIEDQRQGLFANQLDDWGIPTAVSLAEIAAMRLPVKIIASGGIRKADEIAKAIAIGADLAGITGLFLKILQHEGQDGLDTRIESLLYQLKAVFLMSGSRNCAMIREKPVLILGRTAEWLHARNINT